MNKILILCLIVAILYAGWGILTKQSVEPLYSEPYLVLYGRKACGNCQHTIRALDAAGIKFEYKNIDDRAVADSLHKRMEAMGHNTRSYVLPVVDLNNSIFIHPDVNDLVKRAKDLSLDQ